MKVIDRQGRLFGKLSIIDLLIVAVVVAALMVFYMFFVKGTSQIQVVGDKHTVTYTVEVKNVNEAFTKQPQIGQNLFNSSKNTYIGKVVGIEVLPDDDVHQNYETGSHELIDEVDEYKVLITAEGEATIDDRFTLIGSQKIRVGEQLPVKGKGYAGLSYIVEVTLPELEE